MSHYLEKIDPDRNCFRFYESRLEDDLFAEAALVVQWGRIGTRGRIRITTSGQRREMDLAALRMMGMKLRRGYRRC